MHINIKCILLYVISRPFTQPRFFLDKHSDNYIEKYSFNLLLNSCNVYFRHVILRYCNCTLLTHALPIQRPFLLRRDDSCHPPLQDENYHSIFSYKPRLSIFIIRIIAFRHILSCWIEDIFIINTPLEDFLNYVSRNL